MLDHLFGAAPEGSLAGVVADKGRELQRLSAHVCRHCPDLAGRRRGSGRGAPRSLRGGGLGLPGPGGGEALGVDDRRPALGPAPDIRHARARGPEPARNRRFWWWLHSGTTVPDRSDELAARVAELHRLEGVSRLNLSGLGTEAVAEYLSVRAGLSLSEARAPAALLRDRTGGNPFFLRELWADLERQGGVAALARGAPGARLLGDTLTARLVRPRREVRAAVVQLAAVLGSTFDLATLVAASETEQAATLSRAGRR